MQKLRLIIFALVSLLFLSISLPTHAAANVVGYLNAGTNMCTAGIGGWACNGSSTVKVDLYDGPYAGSLNNFIGEATANQTGESAIGQFCAGTTSHRFSYTIPSKWRDGKKHTVYGYINIGDSQIHPMGQQGQTFECTASTAKPTPTNTPGTTPGQSSTTLKLILGLPGIGFNAVGGAAPKHLTRSITVQLYDSTVTNPSGPGTHALASSTGTVTYDNSSDNNAGYFVGNITLHLPSTPAANNKYKVLVEVPQYLYKLAVNAADGTQTFTIENGSLITAPPLLLLPGDAQAASGGKNLLDIDDYTQLLSCFHDASSCATTADGIPVADLDDNGSIDIVDLNLFIRSLFQLQQIQADPPICNGLSCQGD